MIKINDMSPSIAYLVGFTKIPDCLRAFQVLKIFAAVLLFTAPSSPYARDLDFWEIYAWCSMPPTSSAYHVNIFDPQLNRLSVRRPYDKKPFNRLICDDLEGIKIPNMSNNEENLTVDEFNEVFFFAVGDSWSRSIARYELDKYVLARSECISLDGVRSIGLNRPVSSNVAGQHFARKLASDLALVKLAEPYFFGLIDPPVVSIMKGIDLISKTQTDGELWGSLSRLLQDDYSQKRLTELDKLLYEAFVVSIELQIRSNLLDHGQIWHSQSNYNGVALICNMNYFRPYWYYLQSKKSSEAHIGSLKIAALQFVKENRQQEASRLATKISQQDRRQFFCGDPNEVFRDKLREQGYHVPKNDRVGSDVSRYVLRSTTDIDCTAWKQKYFEHATGYINEILSEMNLDVQSFNYSSPFE